MLVVESKVPRVPSGKVRVCMSSVETWVVGFLSVRLGLCKGVEGIDFVFVDDAVSGLGGKGGRIVFVVDVEAALSVLLVCGSGTGGGALVCCVPEGGVVFIFVFEFCSEGSAQEELETSLFTALGGWLPALSHIVLAGTPPCFPEVCPVGM